MKLATVVAISLVMAVWTCGAMAATASGSFNYDFTTDPVCTATVTAPNPPAASVSFNFKVGPPYGSRKWSAVAVAKNGTSSDMTAAQSQATVNVRPGAPRALW
jgi:hypothetical protein